MSARVLSMLLALAASAASRASAQVVFDPGFETSTPILGLPNTTGVWADDVVTFVGASQGVTPRGGSRMARFDFTTPSGPAANTGSELLQIVDLATVGPLVQTGRAVATVEAWFDRVAGDASTDTQFLVTVRAYSGAIASFPVQFNHGELALADGSLVTDSLESTWQSARARLCLPPNTSYVAIRVTAVENVMNDTSGTELAGHFVDDVALTVALDPLAIDAYCVAAPNSVGPGASITATGTTSIAANDFTLVVSGAPPNAPGLFYYGRVQDQIPFGDGWRCIAGTTFRLGPAAPSDPSGVAQRRVDFTVPPAGSGPGAILAHTSWAFQLWYRNVLGPGGTGFNLSNGLAATFCP